VKRAWLAFSGLFASSCASTIRFEHQLEIRRLAQDVFAFVADARNLSRWNYYVIAVKQTTSAPVGAGTQFHLTRKSDAQDIEIVEWQAGHVVAFRTLPPERALTMRFIVEARGTETLLIDAWELDGGTALGRWLAQGRVKRAVGVNLEHLRELLETGRTTLPDGRVSRLP